LDHGELREIELDPTLDHPGRRQPVDLAARTQL
jgi:hypothetical protein